jgi:hypothetical protein
MCSVPAEQALEGGIVRLLAHLGCGDEVVHLVAAHRAHGLCAGLARGLQPRITNKLRSMHHTRGHGLEWKRVRYWMPFRLGGTKCKSHLQTNHDTHALVDCLLRQPGALWHLRQESAGRQLRSFIQHAHIVD